MISMIEQLFGSKTRVKLLRLFYGNPDKSFYVREITRKIDEQINSVRRELSNLLNIGIITSDTTNNKLYYEVNQKYEFYDALLEIFGSAATKKIQSNNSEITSEGVDVELKSLGHIDLLLYTGFFTRDDNSSVDLLIVGDVNKNAVDKYVLGLESEEGREIRYTVLKTDDFLYRKQIKDRFVTSILNSKKQVLLDQKDLLQIN